MAALAQATSRVGERRPRCSILGALMLVGGVIGLAGLVGCSATGSNELPPDVQDPAVIKTPAGALGFYQKVLARLPVTFDSLLTHVGIMTDELMDLPMPVTVANTYTGLDSRTLDSQHAFQASETYRSLHQVRAQARDARGFLAAYVPDSAALAGHLYAVEGYAVVFLADLYCSGVPLSTVNFGADYTLAAGSSTEELYRHAEALFDTALTLASDGAHESVQRLALVGRGRALLALGQYADAATAVGAVPTEFRYELIESSREAQPRPLVVGVSLGESGVVNGGYGYPSVGDGEGGIGLDYRSSGDPRTPVVVLDPTPDPFGNTHYTPAKYAVDLPTTFVLADGIEARLIEAEAALNGGSPASDAWLTTLNALRTDGTFESQPTPDEADDPGAMDTVWHAGTGSVPGLKPLVDPVAAEARVSLLFRERAFWLYLTAHRQGDLRRLVRQYHRQRTAVFPTGVYPGGNGRYGEEVTLPVPVEEQQFNPNYTGCLNRGA